MLEVHGHLREAVCLRCRRTIPAEGAFSEYMLEGKVPHCRDCGGTLKPAAILMGESLPMDVYLDAEVESETCDLMLVAGSSMRVIPAANLPFLAGGRGARLVVVNLQETPADGMAEVVIRRDVAEVLPRIVAACRDMKSQ